MSAIRHPLHIAKSIHDFTLSREALIFSVLLTTLVLLWFSPARDMMLYRTLLASITQDRILAEVNPHRASLGVAPLSVSPLLTEAARLKAEDMIARDYFSHYGPGGEAPWAWFQRTGYAYAGAGENLAIDFSDTSALVSAWLASPTHAANIQNGVFTDLGLGIASGDFQGRDTTIIAMFLGRPLTTTLATQAPQTPVTPVPPSTPTPAPAPQTPTPPPTPAPTPLSQPSPQPLPAPMPLEPPQAPVVMRETEAAPSLSAPLVTEPVSQDVVLVTGNIAAPISATETPPLATTLLEFFLLKAALAMRWLLSISFGATIVTSAALFAMPPHRSFVNRSGLGTIALLLVLLWLPNLI